MKTSNFLEELQYAADHTYAVGAFNIFSYLSARAVIGAASKLDCPVILQTSSVTVKHFGPIELGAMLRQLAWRASVNVLIHLDHCKDVELAKACIDSGWDAVMYDGSELPIEENIANCRMVAEYAHRRGVYIEGELGRIAGVEDDFQVDEADATGISLEESLHFIRESGIDAFAPAIGTAHGVYKGKPHINFELVRQLHAAVDTPIVIHGGTGLSEDTFHKLIKNGGAKINVSTALKHAYLGGCREYMANNPGKVDPIGLDKYLEEAIGSVAKEHMIMFRKTMQMG